MQLWLGRMAKIRRTTAVARAQIRRFRQGTRRSSSNVRPPIDTPGNTAAGCKHVLQPVSRVNVRHPESLSTHRVRRD